MENDIIKQVEKNTDNSAISMMSRGYEDISLSDNNTVEVGIQDEIKKRIESGQLNDVPVESLISYGLEQLTADTAKKREARRGQRKQLQERRDNQDKTFGAVYAEDWIK